MGATGDRARQKVGSVSDFSGPVSGKTTAQKVATTVIVLLLLFVGLGAVTMNASMSYTGSSEEVCTRDSDGQRSCSNPGEMGATFLALAGVPSDDVVVSSQPLLITARASYLAAALVLVFALVALRTNRARWASDRATTSTTTKPGRHEAGR